ncbi:MAG: M20 family metallopeptidase [Pseudoclavibacter sp.]
MTVADARRMRDRLGALVNIETPTGHAVGIEEALDLIDSWFGRGSHPTLIERDGHRHAFWEGASGAPLLLGHVDTVWPLGTLEHRPFEIDGDVARGPGTFDMKAGIVVMAEALSMARHGGEISVLLTADEETGSLTSRPVLEEAAAAASHVLVLEPSLEGDVKVARRGGAMYGIAFEGRAAHAGLEPEAGRNALVELARVVLEVVDLGDAARGTSVSPTVAQSGTATNVIPAAASLRIDARAWTLAELERVDAAIVAIGGVRDDVVITVEGGINRPPMEPDVTRDLLELAREVSGERGLQAVVGASVGGASDANFTAALGVPTLDGLGPRGDGAHAEHEWVSCSSMVERAVLVAEMLDRLVEGRANEGEV